MAGATVYLARVLYAEDGTPIMAVVGDSAPVAVTDEQGRFLFTEVPSNTYGLAVATPLGSFLIQKKDGGDLLITVEAGAVLDVGEIRTDLPY